ncbi:MAG: hypothetical protein OXF93_17175 [Acidobacteria bacterium]|nr:hypothetical protein [Acidobacteriota bacterium]
MHSRSTFTRAVRVLLWAGLVGSLAGAARAQPAAPCAPGAQLTGAAGVQATRDSADDREALEALYHAAGGPDWIDRTNWLSNQPLGTWFGVQTEGGRVTSLDLCGPGGNNLRGSIPPELGMLARLKDLRLSNNALTGPIPGELGDLTELEVLRLSNNALSGPVPSRLGNLAKVWELRLHQNRLTGDLPESVRHMPSLRRLRIENNAGLCTPAADDFRAWLLTLDEFRGDCAAAVPVLPLPGLLGLGLLLLGSAWRWSRRARRDPRLATS